MRCDTGSGLVPLTHTHSSCSSPGGGPGGPGCGPPAAAPGVRLCPQPRTCSSARWQPRTLTSASNSSAPSLILAHQTVIIGASPALTSLQLVSPAPVSAAPQTPCGEQSGERGSKLLPPIPGAAPGCPGHPHPITAPQFPITQGSAPHGHAQRLLQHPRGLAPGCHWEGAPAPAPASHSAPSAASGEGWCPKQQLGAGRIHAQPGQAARDSHPCYYNSPKTRGESIPSCRSSAGARVRLQPRRSQRLGGSDSTGEEVGRLLACWF